jgi:hypothetical protein
MIHVEGSAMWKVGFGASCLMAEWSRFYDLLRLHQTPTHAAFDTVRTLSSPLFSPSPRPLFLFYYSPHSSFFHRHRRPS